MKQLILLIAFAVSLLDVALSSVEYHSQWQHVDIEFTSSSNISGRVVMATSNNMLQTFIVHTSQKVIEIPTEEFADLPEPILRTLRITTAECYDHDVEPSEVELSKDCIYISFDVGTSFYDKYETYDNGTKAAVGPSRIQHVSFKILDGQFSERKRYIPISGTWKYTTKRAGQIEISK